MGLKAGLTATISRRIRDMCELFHIAADSLHHGRVLNLVPKAPLRLLYHPMPLRCGQRATLRETGRIQLIFYYANKLAHGRRPALST
jgi:hypothetical protein